MTNVGERVVLGENGDLGPLPRAHPCPKRGVETGDAAFQTDARQARCFGEPAARPVLLEPKLGLAVDPSREFAQAGGIGVDPRVESLSLEGHPGTISPRAARAKNEHPASGLWHR